MADHKRWEGNWKLGDRLGGGGQGHTHSVSSLDNEVPNAVLKRLKNNKDPQSRNRLFREVSNMRLLHAAKCAVPAVFDENVDMLDQLNAELFVVMEFIPG